MEVLSVTVGAGQSGAMRFRLPKRMRLRNARQFRAVYGARVSRHAGPLLVFARPNDLGYSRLGLSVPRRVGTAVARNRVKRLLREAFRLHQHDLPASYDLVVNVRGPFKGTPTRDEIDRRLAQAAEALDSAWRKKLEKARRSKTDE
jgi:ribonuclease P protein component